MRCGHCWPTFSQRSGPYWAGVGSRLRSSPPSCFPLLGVQLDLGRAAAGCLVVANTPKRIDELTSAIRAALDNRSLDAHAAATLVGRSAFAGAQCFGRTGTAFLWPLREASRSSAPSFVKGRLEYALRWWMTFLQVSAPRTLRLDDPAPPILIFGDRCCEEAFQGVGAIVYDRKTSTFECFGLALRQPVVQKLYKATGSDQVIAQLEIIPVLLATWCWSELFADAGRRCMYFIDNDSARHALIRGYSPVGASRCLVEEYWRDAATLQPAPCFDRVSSSGNPADGPSRLDFKGTTSLPIVPRRIAPPDAGARLLQVLGSGE